jgi:NitT/TauT family transport system ATP-binding protein/sulfonate transport system ATP-binding protein
VLVMSARPGRVKADIPAALGRPRGLRWTGTPELAAIEGAIWEELRAEIPVRAQVQP